MSQARIARTDVVEIPATLRMFTQAPLHQEVKRKVAGYARVSTDSEEQQTSYEAQVKHYTEHIKGNPQWEFAGVYTDEGISATSTKRRKGFNEMIRDALAGKIELIVTNAIMV